MTSAAELLKQLREIGVQLSLDGDLLRLNAPKGALTPAIQSELKAAKADLLHLLQSMRSASLADAAASSIPRVERQVWMPLSFAQQRIWFLQQIDPESTAYNLLAVMRMEGDLDPAALEQSLQLILMRHEALRTIFVPVEGTPYTVLIDGSEWTMSRLMLDRQADESIESAAARFTQATTQQPFRLDQGPLLRAYLLKHTEDDHVLILSIHHIISDGWSMGVAVKELAENYRAIRLEEAPRLNPLPLQYADYTEWQRKYFEGGVLERQLQYWRKQLDSAPAVTVFPPDRTPRPGEPVRGKRSKLVLPADLVRNLEAFGRSHNSTLFMTMLSAFLLLLSRYTGQKDVVVGSPSANRPRAELNDLIGFFVNNLVLRAQVDDGISFLELIQRVRDMTLGAFEHQDIPFDHLVRELQSERNPDHSPLFQTMFILQNFPMDELTLPGLIVTPLEIDAMTARFDLTVEIYPRKQELYAFFDYRADLYDDRTITELQLSFQHVLEQVVSNPEIQVDRVSLLPPGLREQALRHGIGPHVSAARQPLLLNAIRNSARATPHKMAVQCGGKSLTYAELELLSDQLALDLTAAGVRRGSLVPVLLNRSVDLVVALLAVLKAGAAYVPLDPIYPKLRIEGILAEVKPAVILTAQNLISTLEGSSANIIQVKPYPPVGPAVLVVRAQADDIPSSASSEDLAYVIFTSGSTGKPKGVEVAHSALANFLFSMQHTPGFSPDDRLLAVTTISFDIAGLELFLPLYCGGQVVIASNPADLPTLLSELDEVQPTVLQATPALWQMLLSAGWTGNPSLVALCGGEALNADLAAALLPKVRRLWNMYGPTETTIWSSALQVDPRSSISIPVGRPIDNTQFYVLDAHLEPVPIGVAGELFIGGDGLARGYFNRSELTRDRFIPAPLNQLSRLYRTGDLVRQRRDGLLDFLGRVDFQVKLRGFRIELGEIEQALRQQPEVYESVVLLREDGGTKELVAYLVLAQQAHLSHAKLTERLRERLPEYMIPSCAVCLDAMPRLPNGKLDRSKLPAPPRQEDQLPELALTTNWTQTESAMVRVFQQLLHTDRLTVHQRFFEFGAHSLLLVKAHDILRRELDPDLQLISFFQYPSISALAAHIDLHRASIKEEAYASRP